MKEQRIRTVFGEEEEVSQRLKFFVEQVARQFMVCGFLSFSTTIDV